MDYYFSYFSEFSSDNFTAEATTDSSWLDSKALVYVNMTVCCIGIILNLILVAVCIKICMCGTTRGFVCGNAYFFIMWLCLCNFVFLAYRSLFRQFFHKRVKISTDLECKLYSAFEVTVQGFAIFTLVALSLDRSMVVRNPIRGRTLVIRFRYIILLFILVLSILSSVPILVCGKLNKHDVCEYIPRFSKGAKVYEITRGIVMYVIPLCVISTFYVEMAVILFRSRRSSASQNSTNRKERTRQRNRLALSVLLITIVFAVCHFPINLGMYLQEQFVYIELGKRLCDFGRPLVYINACTHPIVVLVINRAVRNELMHLPCFFVKAPPDLRITSQNNFSTDYVSRQDRSYALLTIKETSMMLK